MVDDLRGRDPENEPIYFSGNHNKGLHSVYSQVPLLLSEILDRYPSIEGASIGGSYAKGTYKDGDDVDFDLLFERYPRGADLGELRQEIEIMFSEIGLEAEIRAPFSRTDLPDSMRIGLYQSHPATPFVVRTPEIAEAWGLK